MKKASKMLLNFSGIIGVLAFLSLLVTMFLNILLTFASGALTVIYALIGGIGPIVVFAIIFVLLSPLVLAGLLVLVALFIASIMSFLGVRDNKAFKIISIIFGTSGFLPILIFSGLALLLGLILVAIPPVFVSFITLERFDGAHYILSSLSGSVLLRNMCNQVAVLLVVGFFELFTVSGISFGLIFALLAILGGIFGLIGIRKEKKQKQLIEEATL